MLKLSMFDSIKFECWYIPRVACTYWRLTTSHSSSEIYNTGLEQQMNTIYFYIQFLPFIGSKILKDVLSMSFYESEK